jgi:hypothetical protein
MLARYLIEKVGVVELAASSMLATRIAIVLVTGLVALFCAKDWPMSRSQRTLENILDLFI